MSGKHKFRFGSKETAEMLNGKKNYRVQRTWESPVNKLVVSKTEKNLRPLKKKDLGLRVAEVLRDDSDLRSGTGSPTKGRPEQKRTCEKRDNSPTAASLQEIGSSDSIQQKSINSILKNHETNQQKLEIKETTHGKSVIQPDEENKTLVKRIKNCEALKKDFRNVSVFIDRNLIKDHELLVIKQKASTDIKKKGKNSEKKNAKTMRGRKIEDTQTPSHKLPKTSIETKKMKSPEIEKKVGFKLESINKIKLTDKKKAKTNRVKSIKISEKNQNFEMKKYSQEVLQRDKEVALITTLKPKRVKFDSFREKLTVSVKADSKNTSSRSNLSASESPGWVNLNFDKYDGGPSDFVGEFLEKLNQDKKFSSKIKTELTKKPEADKNLFSNCCASAELLPLVDPNPCQKPQNFIPKLSLSNVNTNFSNSIGHCDENRDFCKKKDSEFKSIYSVESKCEITEPLSETYKHKTFP